jgi:hypothetical protein
MPGGEDSFIGDLTLEDYFEYRQGKSVLVIEVAGPESRW